MNKEEINKLFKDNPIKTIKCGDIEVPVEYLKQTAVTINGDDYIRLQKENKQLKHIIDELEKWLKDYIKLYDNEDLGIFEDAIVSTLEEVLYKLQELKGSDKE